MLMGGDFITSAQRGLCQSRGFSAAPQTILRLLIMSIHLCPSVVGADQNGIDEVYKGGRAAGTTPTYTPTHASLLRLQEQFEDPMRACVQADRDRLQELGRREKYRMLS